MDDIEAIRQLKARYFRFLDTKDWAGYRTVFTDDVVIDVTGSGGGIYRGIDAYMDYILGYVAGLRTVHHGHMPEITLTSPTSATGIWAMEDRVATADGREINGQGHYHETYARIDGAWRIATMRLTRLCIHADGQTRWW